MDTINKNKKKHTMGRRKIEIKKIEEKSSRQVTFSKRRNGLFRKASELCILSGAEAAIFVASPKGKIFSFGHTSVEAIVSRYMHDNGKNLEGFESYCHSQGGPICQLPESLEQLRILEDERDRLKATTSLMNMANKGGRNNGHWWDRDVDGMELEELEEYRESLKELKQKVELKSKEKGMIKMSPQINFGDIDKKLEINEEQVHNKAFVNGPHHDDYAFEFHNFDF
ncbi:hypothetical protein Leryth_002867 [Lithospermum erythrorhizon]|nr:hypothetical protein Leryth_002867 [Lithospermum erythrorhizon]